MTNSAAVDTAPSEPLADLVGGIRFAMITIDGPDGLSARPLTVQQVTDEEVWFLVGQGADWLPPADSAVNLAFTDDSRWVSVTGTVSTTVDPAVLEALGDPVSDVWFQDGHEPLALCVAVEHGTWWTSPGFVRSALALAGARITGRQPHLGDTGELA